MLLSSLKWLLFPHGFQSLRLKAFQSLFTLLYFWTIKQLLCTSYSVKNYLRRISLKNLHGNKRNSYANLKKNVICIVEQISTFNCFYLQYSWKALWRSDSRDGLGWVEFLRTGKLLRGNQKHKQRLVVGLPVGEDIRSSHYISVLKYLFQESIGVVLLF